MSKAKIIYWRDIPTQVVIGSGRRAAKRPLADRFMVAVDKAAMQAGITSDDAYLADWKTHDVDVPEGEPATAAETLAAKFEAEFPASRLAEIARNGGLDTKPQDQA